MVAGIASYRIGRPSPGEGSVEVFTAGKASSKRLDFVWWGNFFSFSKAGGDLFLALKALLRLLPEHYPAFG